MKRWLIAIWGLYIMGGLWHMALTPLWERYDELNHYLVVRHRGGLPLEGDLSLPPDYAFFSQFDQPPLYHTLAGLSVSLSDSAPFTPPVPLPASYCATTDSPHHVIHNRPAEHWLSPAHRGIWLARLLTALTASLGVPLVAWAAHIIWRNPARTLVTAALMATFPAGVALGSWLNNDAALIPVGAAVLVLIARTWRSGPTWTRFVLYSGLVLIGLSIKLNALALLAAGLYLLPLRRPYPWRLIGLAVSALLLAVVGLQIGLCGAPLCRTHLPLTPEQIAHASGIWRNDVLIDGLQHFLKTITIPALNPHLPLYLAPAGITLTVLGLGAGSSLYDMLHSAKIRALFIGVAAIIGAAIGLSLVRIWWTTTGFMPARYLAVAFPAIVLMLAHGLFTLHPRLALAGVAGLLAVTLLVPPLHYAPLWQTPPTPDRVPAAAQPVQQTFENGLRVIGYTADEKRLTLYLDMSQMPPDTPPLYLQATHATPSNDPLSRCGHIAGGVWQPMTAPLVAQSFVFDFPLQPAEMLELRLYSLYQPHYLSSRLADRVPVSGQNQPVIRLTLPASPLSQSGSSNS